MRITDNAGRSGIILARMWDGERWVVVPERMMDDNYWWLINYLIKSMSFSVLHECNLDDNFALMLSLSVHRVFPPEPPIPI